MVKQEPSWLRAIRVIESDPHKIVSEPSDDTVIFRYLTVGRFVALLAQRGIYFARPEAFADPFETTIGADSLRDTWIDSARRMFREVLQAAELDGKLPKLTDMPPDLTLDEQVEHLVKEYMHLAKIIHMNTYISCWHEGNHESEAMWRLYSRNETEGIAIRSTVGRLRASLPELPLLRIGRVRYVEFDGALIHPYFTAFFKRLAFQHEREIRAAFIATDEEPGEEPGKLIEVSLDRLVDEVVLSPYAPAWLQGVVDALCKRFALGSMVRCSSLLGRGFRS